MANDEQGTGLGSAAFPGTTIYPETHDTSYPSPLMIRGWCTGSPSDTTANRYAPGAELLQTDANVPTMWKNVGTTAVPVWASSSGGLSVAHAVFNSASDTATVGTVTPAITAQIPAYAILVGGTINSTTAVAATGGAASISVGVSAGLSPTTTSILGATAKGNYTTDALINATPTFASPLKMSAAGKLTFTITGNTITAGVVEAFVYYAVALNS